MSGEWMIPGATCDGQVVTAEWNPARMRLIDGVRIREVKHVPKANGHLTEVYRADWAVDAGPVDQIFQVVLFPGQVSAWHAHAATLDRLFVTQGLVRIVLFDRRTGSPTQGLVNEFRFGDVRPALVVIPPMVWHGVQNMGPTPASMLNVVDRAYDYQHPDHWRVPHDSPEIPFTFPSL